jgi:hypothetical protein
MDIDHQQNECAVYRAQTRGNNESVFMSQSLARGGEQGQDRDAKRKRIEFRTGARYS